MLRAVFALFLSLLIALTHASAADNPRLDKVTPEIRVVIAVPPSSTFFLQNDDSHLDVVVENISPNPLNLYDSVNSWGYDNIRVDWEAGGKKGTIKFAPQPFYDNAPTTTVIPQGAAMIRSVPIGKDCEGWPTFTEGMKITVTATYESIQKGPGWLGKETSTPVTLQIHDLRKK